MYGAISRPATRGRAGKSALRPGRRSADDAHHLVEVGHGDHQAEQDVRPLARLGELVLAAARDHFLAEADERLDDVLEVQRLGPTAADRQHVGREARLRRRVPPQLVQHHLDRGVALQVDDDAHAFAVRFVADVADALDALVLGGLGHLLDQAVLAGLVGMEVSTIERRSPRPSSTLWRARMMIEPRPVW
jgi:hypothetical protein